MIGVRIRWTSALDDALRGMHLAGCSQGQIGASVKISASAVSTRMRALGLKANGHPHSWHPEEDARLKRKYLGGMTVSAIALDMGKTHGAVIGRVWRLKLKRDPRISKENMQRGARNRGGMRLKNTITARSANEAVWRHQLRERIYSMEPDSSRRIGEPVYWPKFL